MDDILLMEAVERYLNNEMSAEEKLYFEQLRTNTPEVDQLVVEHKLFIQQLNQHTTRKNLVAQLTATHEKLLTKGDITKGIPETTGAKLVQFYQKYRRVTAIAASIAAVTAVMISALVSYLQPGNAEQLQQLSQELDRLKRNQQVQSAQIKAVTESKIPAGATITGGGTGFLIDAKGYLVTNAHVVKKSKLATIINSDGQEYKAEVVANNAELDLAILKINDADYKPNSSLPYSIKKDNTALGAELYTLGFPRNEIVYNMGYLSAKTGFDGDTVTCQISLNANPGNSGGPVFNKDGEVVAVISKRETQADGVIFAVRSAIIHGMLTEAQKTDTAVAAIKLSSKNRGLKNLERTLQVKKLENYVFMVKAYN